MGSAAIVDPPRRDETMRLLAAATAGLRRCLDFVLIVLVVAVLVGVLLAKLVPLTGRQTIVIGGASMEPAIGLGSAIVIKPVPADGLHVGDVVTLQAGPDKALFTHRIIDVVDRADGRWIRTKGDANESPDPTLVHESAVIGRSEFSIPLAGYLIALLSVPTGVLFLVGLGATLLAAAWLLESLELERSERRTVRLAPAIDRSRGEPIALRVITPRSLAAVGPPIRAVRLTTSEQVAVVRAARRARNSGSASSRRAPRRSR
jgi:signal peptidase I